VLVIENLSNKALRTKIDLLRDNMIHCATTEGFHNEKTIATSQKLDKYLTEYQNRSRAVNTSPTSS